MPRRFHAAKALTLVLMLSQPPMAAAQSVKPGLWEITQRIGGNPQVEAAMAQMQQQMAALSPEQRRAMQDMLAKQGLSMPGAAAGGGMSMRFCLTPEMAARNEPPPTTEGQCSSRVTHRSASEMKVAFQCTEPPSSGESTIRFQGDGAYQSVTQVNTQVAGKSERTTIEGAARWLGANCGDVRPRP